MDGAQKCPEARQVAEAGHAPRLAPREEPVPAEERRSERTGVPWLVLLSG